MPEILPPRFEGIVPPRSEASKNDGDTLGQEQFFDLMIAQLTNQDPLKPLEGNEFLAQVAQFSTVSGIQNVEKSITQLATSLQSSQALQASTLVGRDVLVPGETAVLSAGGTVAGAVELDAGAERLVIKVVDNAGQLVRRLELGPHGAGMVNFAWDGLGEDGQAAAPGTYQVQAEALIGGQNEAVATLVASRVESVTLNRQSPNLTLNLKNLGAVDMNDVRQLL